MGNHHFNNIYAGVGRALSVTGTLPEHEDKFYNNKVVMTGTDVGNINCKDKDVHADLSNNVFFTPSGQASVCGKSLAEAQEAGLDTGSSVAKTSLDEEIIAWGKQLLGITDQI